MTVVVRFDDECNNGHNTFGITCTIKSRKYGESGGCQHEEIAERFPELAHLIKYHGCTADGPLHYIANTMYWIENKEYKRACSTAIWESADFETMEDIEQALNNRLPMLLAKFQETMEKQGFIY